MSVRASAGKLAKATKQLMLQWETLGNSWRDTKAMEFERKYIEPLPNAVNSATKVMDEIDKILNKIRNECE